MPPTGQTNKGKGAHGCRPKVELTRVWRRVQLMLQTYLYFNPMHNGNPLGGFWQGKWHGQMSILKRLLQLLCGDLTMRQKWKQDALLGDPYYGSQLPLNLCTVGPITVNWPPTLPNVEKVVDHLSRPHLHVTYCLRLIVWHGGGGVGWEIAHGPLSGFQFGLKLDMGWLAKDGPHSRKTAERFCVPPNEFLPRSMAYLLGLCSCFCVRASW